MFSFGYGCTHPVSSATASTLAQHLRRCPNIKPTLVRSLAFAVIPWYWVLLDAESETRHWPNAGLRWASVCDARPTLTQHWVNFTCLLDAGSEKACVDRERARTRQVPGWSSTRMTVHITSLIARWTHRLIYTCTPRLHCDFFTGNMTLKLTTLKYLEVIINVLVNTFRFIWWPMLGVCVHYKYFYTVSAGINFIRQNLTSTDIRFRQKLVDTNDTVSRDIFSII